MIWNIIKILLLVSILLFLTKMIIKKYIQWQTVKKYKKVLGVLREEKDKKIPIESFTLFLTDNVNTNQDTFFKEKIKEFVELYSSHHKQTGISILEIFICWITRIRHDILFTPGHNLSVNEYQSIYESENENVFEKIEHQYKLNIQSGTNDELLKNRLFYLRLSNAIELFLNKYAKENDTLFVFYWFDFYKFFLRNISKIDYKTWFVIETSLNEKV